MFTGGRQQGMTILTLLARAGDEHAVCLQFSLTHGGELAQGGELLALRAELAGRRQGQRRYGIAVGACDESMEHGAAFPRIITRKRNPGKGPKL